MANRKTVLITGCSDGGLGSALAVAFHEANWRVLASARNPSKMTLMNKHAIETLKLDVQSAESLKECLAEVIRLTNGRLDVLFNNAGGGYSMQIADMSMGSVRSLFELNVFSLITTAQTFIPLLTSNPSGTAMIVNHSSTAGEFCIPFNSAYHASKAAAIMLNDGMRLELAPFGVKVVNLGPEW